MDDVDRSEEPNLNTGTPWSTWDDQDIRWGLDHNRSIVGFGEIISLSGLGSTLLHPVIALL
jgi:hypothetical protein